MPRPVVITARTATTFAADGSFDPDAFSRHLARMTDAGIGILLASCGSGEGGSLSRDELRSVYQAGVAACKGRVLVASNQPEQFTARASIEQALLAIEAGVDLLNIYGPYGLHGYRPTDEEYTRYFDRILTEIDYPVSLCPHSSLGYSPKPSVLARLAGRYPQVKAIILSGVAGDGYFVELTSALDREVDVYTRYDGSLHTLGSGAVGIDVQEANFVPRTVRSYVDLYEAGDYPAALQVWASLKQLTAVCERWKPSSARWIKMALRVFRLPGGEGGLREPYLMPAQDQLDAFTAAVLALGIPEINDMAMAAGLA